MLADELPSKKASGEPDWDSNKTMAPYVAVYPDQGMPKVGDICPHCKNAWLPSPSGSGIWHNCHTGPSIPMTNSHAETRSYAWILYDGRAESGDTDEAAVLEAFSSRKDLKSLYHWIVRGEEGVLFEYDVENGKDLVNERMIGRLSEGKAALLAKCSRLPQPQPTPEPPNFSPNFDERGEEPWKLR